MSLIRSLEQEGNWLFRKRSYIPLVLFVLAIPFVFVTDYSGSFQQYHSLLLSICITISALGFAIRMYAVGSAPAGTSGRNRGDQKAEKLNTTGMYSMVRHSLYPGNYLIWIGIVLYAFNLYFFVIVSLLFWIYYERIMIAEEKHLERTYGDAFLIWSTQVPAFIPSVKHFKPSALPWSWKIALSREDNGILATVISFFYVDLLIDLRVYGEPRFTQTELIIAIVTVAVLLPIRILRKSTTFFQEQGR